MSSEVCPVRAFPDLENIPWVGLQYEMTGEGGGSKV